MRLLNVEAPELELKEFFGDKIPPYAIFSHMWVDDELSFQDSQHGQYEHKEGSIFALAPIPDLSPVSDLTKELECTTVNGHVLMPETTGNDRSSSTSGQLSTAVEPDFDELFRHSR